MKFQSFFHGHQAKLFGAYALTLRQFLSLSVFENDYLPILYGCIVNHSVKHQEGSHTRR